jgi:hypothetical protein
MIFSFTETENNLQFIFVFVAMHMLYIIHKPVYFHKNITTVDTCSLYVTLHTETTIPARQVEKVIKLQVFARISAYTDCWLVLLSTVACFIYVSIYLVSFLYTYM